MDDNRPQEYVLLNGGLLPRKEASVSVDDSGFLYGFGSYDTMLALEGRPLFLEQHIKRLNNSLKELKILNASFSLEKCERDIVKLLSTNGHKNARVRITITRGVINLNEVHIPRSDTIQLITSTQIADDYFNRDIQPMRLLISRYIRNHPLSVPPSLKLTSLANHLFASIEAKDKGFDDAIMVNHLEDLTEGSSFNLFFVRQGVIYTPHLDSGILPGITRAVLLNLFMEKGITCEEGHYHRERLYEADEIFITSSVRGIVPVIQVDDRTFHVGQTTNSVISLYYDLLKSLSKGK